MTDRELLELAAKATGIDLKPMQINNVREQGDGRFVGYMTDPEQWSRGWFNPLVDDGDALRLAVKLDIEFLPAYTMDGRGVIARGRNNGGNECFCLYVEEGINGNIYSATRRAIVRAAAEIGKQMEGNNDIRK